MLNWAQNIAYRASGIERPGTIEELSSLVAQSERVKVLGSRHSFNRIADTSALHLSLNNLPPCLEIDHERATISVSANLAYGEFCQQLHQNGFALHNLASLPHISVAGACATATHGSGLRHRNLAAAVMRLDMITADGKAVTLSRGDPGFTLAVVGLGALGIVYRITLELEPTYHVRQWVYESLPMAHLDNYFEELMHCAYSVSLFTDWRHDTFTQVWLKERIGDSRLAPGTLARAKSQLESLGALPAQKPLHPVMGDPDHCTRQMGEAGPWHDRLPHFRMSFTPSAGAELQSEYLIPLADAPNAIRALNSLHAQISPLILVSEVRTIAADDFKMSPCYQQDRVAIHFTWRQHLGPEGTILPSGLTPEIERVLHLIEEALDPFDPRPHLGKLFTMTPLRLQSAYRNLPLFREHLKRSDPQGKFRNEFLDHYVIGH
jgi:xylitol oxidase